MVRFALVSERFELKIGSCDVLSGRGGASIAVLITHFTQPGQHSKSDDVDDRPIPGIKQTSVGFNCVAVCHTRQVVTKQADLCGF